MTNIVYIDRVNVGRAILGAGELINRGDAALNGGFLWKSGSEVILPKNEKLADVPEPSKCKVLDITSHIKERQINETLDIVEAVFWERYLPRLTEADCTLLMEYDSLSRIKNLAEICMRIDLELAQETPGFRVYLPGQSSDPG